MLPSKDTIDATRAMVPKAAASTCPTIGIHPTSKAATPAMAATAPAMSVITPTTLAPQLSHQPSFRSPLSSTSRIAATARRAASSRSSIASRHRFLAACSSVMAVLTSDSAFLAARVSAVVSTSGAAPSRPIWAADAALRPRTSRSWASRARRRARAESDCAISSGAA